MFNVIKKIPLRNIKLEIIKKPLEFPYGDVFNKTKIITGYGNMFILNK